VSAIARQDGGPLRAMRVLQSAGSELLVQAVLHGQLAAIEWEQEKHRLQRMLALTLAGFACLLCTLLFAGALALSASWDTGYRIHVLAVLVLLSGFGTAAAWQRFGIRSSAGDRSFAASREELAADLALLKAKGGRLP
jgi:uncharacterized membrane protein YqjE